MLNSRSSVLVVCAAVMAMGVATAEEKKTKEDEKAPTAEHVAKLVKNLGDESFEVREAASKALKKLGASAKPMLREALKKLPDREDIRRDLEYYEKQNEGQEEGEGEEGEGGSLES